MAIKDITNSASSDAQKSTSSQPIEEARDNHGFGVLGHSTWNKPYEKERKRNDVNVSPAIELSNTRSATRTSNSQILGRLNEPQTTDSKRAGQFLNPTRQYRYKTT
jgi:hypothetical protein